MNGLLEKILDFNLHDGSITLPLTVWAVYIGVMVAVLLSLISRVCSHKIVTAVISFGAHSPDTAKSPHDLGLGNGFICKLLLRRGAPLRKYIRYNGKELYLPEDKRIGAELRFSRERHPVMTFVFAAVVFFIAACMVIVYLPQIIAAYQSVRQ